MKKFIKSFVCTLLSVCLVTAVLNYPLSLSAATTESSLRSDIAALQAESAKLQKEISKLKSEKSNQSAILSAIQKKVANTQAQILRCNREIDSINSTINANKAEINKNNEKIESNKLSFKKRLRAIGMSNSGSQVQILLGAEDFANFLQLSQLTSSVSSHDKRMIEDMVAAIKVLEEKNAENEKLLNEQVSIKSTIVEAQNQLKAEEAEAQKIYNSINNEQKSVENENKAVQNEIKEKNDYLNRLLYGGATTSFVNSKVGFLWPVPSCQNITSGFGPRWGTIHKGIDISNGGIYGKPIVAITDGVVYETYNGCPHKDKASRCRCGSGWGNHVAIDHGYVAGEHIKAMYAHMDSIAVSNGQSVTKGQVIGYVGTTGDSTGYHLHFGIMRNNDGYVNPMLYYSKVK